MVSYDQPDIRFDAGHFYDEAPTPLPPPLKNMSIHISLAFAQLGDSALDEFASNIALKMVANVAIFATPPFPIGNLTTAQGNFHTSLAATTQGGTAATADKNAKRTILLNLLRQLAKYVEDLPGLTLTNALLSGFNASVSGVHTAVSLTVPVILGISNVGTGQLGIKLQGSAGATGYEFRVTVGAGAPVHAGNFSSTRNIVLTGLVTGANYAVQVRAMGGNNQISPWSDPVNHVST
jgi:hypothetical protein